MIVMRIYGMNVTKATNEKQNMRHNRHRHKHTTHWQMYFGMKWTNFGTLCDQKMNVCSVQPFNKSYTRHSSAFASNAKRKKKRRPQQAIKRESNKNRIYTNVEYVHQHTFAGAKSHPHHMPHSFCVFFFSAHSHCIFFLFFAIDRNKLRYALKPYKAIGLVLYCGVTTPNQYNLCICSFHAQMIAMTRVCIM